MTAGSDRLDSLDVFRGLSIAAMILVSTPGTWSAVYTPLDHALWHGWTVTDLVFPFLLFAMGAAVPFALARRRGTERRVGQHIVRRAVILFALGLALNAIEAALPIQWATFRIPGVLQRIAIVFLAVAWLTEHGSLRVQIATVVAALAGYWAALTFIPVPGAGAGVLTPAGNFTSFVDRALLGRHLLSPLFDPEGLLSTLPAIATAMCGVFAGDWLKERRQSHHSAWLFVAGLAAMIAGLAWDRVFPINKNLWTSSFALFSAGLARVVAAARGLRAESARRLFPLGRVRQHPHARERERRIAQGDRLSERVRTVAASVLRRRRGVARVRDRLRGAVGRDSGRDVPPPHFHPHLNDYRVTAVGLLARLTVAAAFVAIVVHRTHPRMRLLVPRAGSSEAPDRSNLPES